MLPKTYKVIFLKVIIQLIHGMSLVNYSTLSPQIF